MYGGCLAAALPPPLAAASSGNTSQDLSHWGFTSPSPCTWRGSQQRPLLLPGCAAAAAHPRGAACPTPGGSPHSLWRGYHQTRQRHLVRLVANVTPAASPDLSVVKFVVGRKTILARIGAQHAAGSASRGASLLRPIPAAASSSSPLTCSPCPPSPTLGATMQQACLTTRASFVAGRSAAPARRGRSQQVCICGTVH